MSIKRKCRVGEVFIGSYNQKASVIENFNDLNNTIQFEDGTIIYNIRYGNLCKGSFRNPNNPEIRGVGYRGIGKHKTSIDGKHTQAYRTFTKMIERCYSESDGANNKTYQDVIVCEEWCNFQIFAKWFDNNYVEGWCLDKDVLVKDNRLYSPKTCCFVPMEINMLFIRHTKSRTIHPPGVTKNGKKFTATITMYSKHKYIGIYNTPEEAFKAYKKVKESYVKEVAEKWKDQVSEKVYNAMLDYQVLITD